MAPQSGIFPIYLRAEYREDTNGVPKFISRIQQAAKISEAELARVGNALNKALSSPPTGRGALDLGIPQLREQIRAQEQAAAAAREVQNALLAVANATGKFDAALSPTINAYRDLAKAKEADAAASRSQLSTLQALEGELEKGTRAVQARLQAEQRLADFRKTVNLNEGALRTARGEAAIDRAALSGATLNAVLGRVNRGSNPLVEQQRTQEAVAAQALARAQEELAASAERLIAQIDPLAAAQQRYDATLEEAQRLLQAGAISTEQFAQAQAFASTQLERTENQIRGVAQAEALRTQQQREAEAAQRGLASAAAQLRAELDPMFAAQQKFDQELARADALFEAGTISSREYAAAQELARQNLREAAAQITGTARATDELNEAQRRGTTARSNVINSVRAERVAFVQLGQQLQDVTVQAQAGTDGFIIFGQQVPQAAFALSGLSESSNETLSKIGEFATFLSGPWGAALFAATAVLGPFIADLITAGDESEAAAEKSVVFASSLDVLSLSAENATSQLDDLIGRLESAIKLQGDYLRGDVALARKAADDLQRQIREDEATIAAYKKERDSAGFLADIVPLGVIPGNARNPVRSFEISQVQERLAKNREALPKALEAAGAASIAEANRNIAESIDPIQKKINEVDNAIAKLNQRRLDTVTANDPLADNNLTQQDFESELGVLARRRAELEKQQKDAKKKPKADRSAERREREVESLAAFAEKAANRVGQINDRFSEQTRLVTQSLQANRELDQIIEDTNRKMRLAKNLTADQRKEFEGIIKAAEDARQTIDDALVRPFEDLRRESEERLQVQELLARGQADEAAALQAILQLQRQIGTEAELEAALQRAITEGKKTEEERIRNLLTSYNSLMEGVRQRVLEEQQVTRELRDQQAVFDAQLDVLGQVRRDLTAILSGRSTDFFGNFKQALLDLQGQRLFEAIFGDAFRDIENELQKNTPQGRANAAYAQQVERTASATARVGDAAISLAEAFDRAFGIMENGTAAANDNGLPVSAREAAEALWDDLTTGEIVVEARVARNSVADLAARISKGIGDSIGVQLEDLLGPRFASALGNVIGGFLAGKALGGTPGGIIGALRGAIGLFADKDGKLSKTLASIDRALGKAGEGAATGTQVAAIGRALGIKTSELGGQIGGAIGSFIPIPGGQLIGSILGSVVGGLFKKTPRASATIGGVGNSLGITGVTGTSAALRTAAGGLGDSVLESINRIAQQLGASVDASAGRVSIGQRKGSLRVDTSGRGVTKVGNGAVDFGEDAQAAIAFAVRDLIQDGVIKGLRQSEQNLLKAGKDVEAALSDVLRFRAVFDELDAIKDPVGSAVRKLNTEFESLITLFEKAGASTEEFASLEELYNLKRAEAIKEATDRVVGSLRQLLNDLKIGDSGLSLRDRRANALGEFNALAARVAAGDTSAFDDFADISKQLLDIERQLFGSTQSYFDRLQQVTALTEKAIADQTNVTSIGASQPSPFDDRTSIARAIESTGAEQVSILRAINDNLILALSPGRRPVTGGGGDGGTVFSVLPQQVLSF